MEVFHPVCSFSVQFQALFHSLSLHLLRVVHHPLVVKKNNSTSIRSNVGSQFYHQGRHQSSRQQWDSFHLISITSNRWITYLCPHDYILPGQYRIYVRIRWWSQTVHVVDWSSLISVYLGYSQSTKGIFVDCGGVFVAVPVCRVELPSRIHPCLPGCPRPHQCCLAPWSSIRVR